jgi:hypothetical protein
MKKADAEKLLEHLQSHSSELNLHDATKAISALRALLKLLPGPHAVNAFRVLPTLKIGADAASGQSAIDCARTLSAYANLIRVTGKAAVAKGLDEIVLVLHSCGQTRVDQLLAAALDIPPPAVKGRSAKIKRPANEPLIASYNKALEGSLGDDTGFNEVLEKLQNDKTATPEDVIALAKRFAGASTKARGAALKKIESRHLSLMSSRARSAATAGRVAG